MRSEPIENSPSALGQWLYEEYCLCFAKEIANPLPKHLRPSRAALQGWEHLGIQQQVWIALGQRLWHKKTDDQGEEA